MTKYRGYTIEPALVPIPGDWYSYYHEDYDGDEDHRAGVARGIEQAKEWIDMLEDD